MNFHSGLEKGVQIDNIQFMDEAEIVSSLESSQMPFFVLVEKMAQTGAFHIRSRTRFQMHIFLLGIQDLSLPFKNLKSGIYQLRATVKAFAERAFSYTIILQEKGSPPIVSGNFLFAGTAYNDIFLSHILKPHYQKVAKCLKNDSLKS